MAIAFVNGTNRTSAGSGSGPNFPMPAFNCSAGNFLFLAVGYDRDDVGAGAQPTAISDTAGNTYTRLGGQTYASTNQGTINWYYAKNTLAHASNVITINITGFTNSISWHEAAVTQWSGVDTVDPIIQHLDHQLASATYSSPSITTSEECVFIASAGWWGDTLYTNSTGYTNREVSANGDALQIDSLADADGGTSFCTWNFTGFFEESSRRGGACTTAIRPTGGGGGIIVPERRQAFFFS
jgi:hypothetical protein